MSIEINIKKKIGNFTLSVVLSSADEIIGLLGSSGCGKSMTLRCIAGVESPDEGYIRVNGQTFYDSKKRINLPPRKRHVGMLFQNYALFPNMTLEENILCGFPKEIKDKELKRSRLEELLKQFQLTELRKQYPSSLSGGQQQRATLARCLASNPQILLLDEPFSSLDASLKSNLQMLMQEQLSQFHGSVILVTHDRDEAYLLSDQIAIMNKGQILRQGSKEEIFQNPGTMTAARIVGCKNVLAAKKSGSYTIHIPGWNQELIFPSDIEIPDAINGIGIRSHDFIPVYKHDFSTYQSKDTPTTSILPLIQKKQIQTLESTANGNLLPVSLQQLTEYPFQWNLNFKTQGEENLLWILNKDTIKPEEKLRIPDYLKISPEKVLFLFSD